MRTGFRLRQGRSLELCSNSESSTVSPSSARRSSFRRSLLMAAVVLPVTQSNVWRGSASTNSTIACRAAAKISVDQRRIGPAAAMDAAVASRGIRSTFSCDDLQGPGRGGGVGVEVLDVRPQDRADAAILANQRREVEIAGRVASIEH